MEDSKNNSGYLGPALGGGIAGLAVEIMMYPLDTLKTRLQSKDGFHKTGGFKNLYKGLSTQAVASVPVYAMYFLCYEQCKAAVLPLLPPQYAPLGYMVASGVSEFAYRTEGIRKGLYRGFLSAVMRDLPVGFIDLPIWESLKSIVARHNDGHVTTLQSACCGSIATLVATAMTTPIDVATTRIMLADPATSKHSLGVFSVLTNVYYTAGIKGLWSGVVPRASFFAVGGFVFFGIYDDVKNKVEVLA